MSATPDSTLADPQQIIADLKRQLAESNAERDEAQAQQAATAEVLAVINSSPGDLAPVFDAMLERAMRLCGVAHGSLQAYDGECFRAVAVRGLPEQLAEAAHERAITRSYGRGRALVDGARLVHVPDLIARGAGGGSQGLPSPPAAAHAPVIAITQG